MFGLEKYGIKLGIPELLEMGANPKKALSFIQQVVDKLYNSDSAEAMQLAKQILPDMLPAYDVDFDIDEDYGEKMICIVIVKKTAKAEVKPIVV